MKNSFIGYIMGAAFAAISLAGCQKEPNGYEVDKDALVLEVFGPNPVVRGEELTFVGQNLNRIKSVILPEGIEIPSSEFIDAGRSSFSVTVPMECEEGHVALLYNGGEIVSDSELTYTEEFTIAKVYPQEAGTARLQPGDSLVVEGEYLDNIAKFVFGNGAVAEGDLIGTQTRYMVCFAVPAGAVSGRVYAEDWNGNQVYFPDEVSVLQPEITDITPTEGIRPGETSLTISGTLLDYITFITFPGVEEPVEDFEFDSVSETEIEVTVPEGFRGGKLGFSTGAEQTFEPDFTLGLAAPAVSCITADAQVQSEGTFTIEGTDLDLVERVTVGGQDCGFVYDDASSSVTVTVSAAVPEGTMDVVIYSRYGTSVMAGTVNVDKLPVPVTLLEEGKYELPTDTWGNGSFSIEAAKFAGIESGCIMIVEYSTKGENTPQLKFADLSNNWSDMPEINDGKYYDLAQTLERTELRITLTDNTIATLKEYGIALQGQNVIIYKVHIIYENY